MIVASRYAKSLIDLTSEVKKLEQSRIDMLLVKEVCDNNREFIMLLQSPIVKTDKKLAIFKSIFEGKISETSAAFLNLIISKRREVYIKDICIAFEEQYKIKKNITTVRVTSAIKLDANLKKQILEIIKQAVKGEIDLIEKLDSSLIGGFILTINDTQVDQSVKRKLNDLKKTFSGNINLN